MSDGQDILKPAPAGVTAAKLAHALAADIGDRPSVVTIKNWRGEGMPAEWDDAAGAFRYEVEACRAWWRASKSDAVRTHGGKRVGAGRKANARAGVAGAVAGADAVTERQGDLAEIAAQMKLAQAAELEMGLPVKLVKAYLADEDIWTEKWADVLARLSASQHDRLNELIQKQRDATRSAKERGLLIDRDLTLGELQRHAVIVRGRIEGLAELLSTKLMESGVDGSIVEKAREIAETVTDQVFAEIESEVLGGS